MNFNLLFSFYLTIKFLDSNNIFANGSIFSQQFRQDSAKQPLIANNSIQSWSYTHLKSGLRNGSEILYLKTSFKSIDQSKGLIQGLTLEVIDKNTNKSTFSLTATQKDEISSKQKTFFEIGFSLVLGFAYIFQFALENVNVKVNFGYASARFLTFWTIYKTSIYGDLTPPGFIVLFIVQMIEMAFMLIFWGLSFNKHTFLIDLKELCCYKAPLIIVGKVLLIIFTLDENYYPMVVFVPMLMAWVDRLQSGGCQELRFLFTFELSKFIVVLIGCYFPRYYNLFSGSLLMSFDYPGLALFFFVGFIAIPGLFFAQHFFSKKAAQELDLVLKREVIHGKAGKSNPVFIQEGQGDIVPTRWKILSVDFPSVFSNKKVPFYHSKSFLGVIEVGLTKSKYIFLVRPIEQMPTGYLHFYRYSSRRNPTSQYFPQHCQRLGYKPHIKFKVLNQRGYVGMVNIIPVETPESTSEQKFVAIVTKSYGKPLFFEKVMKKLKN